MSQDFFSFERVLRELQMQEEELKRLVSEGEIRAFRDQDKMKFKKEDIDRFKGVNTDATLEEIPEELVFDEDDADQDVGMATAAIEDDSFLEEEDEPLELATEAAAGAAAGKSRRPARTTSSSRRPRVLVEEPEATEGVLWLSTIIAATVLLAFGIFVALDAAQGSASALTGGISGWVKSTFMS